MKSVRADGSELLICVTVREQFVFKLRGGEDQRPVSRCSVVSTASHPHGAHSSPFNNVTPFHPCSRSISLSSLSCQHTVYTHTHKKHKPWCTDALKKKKLTFVSLLICLFIHSINKTLQWVYRLTEQY